MAHIDQRSERGVRAVIPAPGRSLAAGILRGRDNLEIAALQVCVNFLPAWQIEPAASPGRPGDCQHLLAAKIGEVNDAAGAIRNAEIGRDARVIKIATYRGNLAEAPPVCR